jgi:hypothetical protein
MGVRIEPPIVEFTKRNASDYRMNKRTEYVQSSGEKIPFDDETFDAVFTNGSPHECFCLLRIVAFSSLLIYYDANFSFHSTRNKLLQCFL